MGGVTVLGSQSIVFEGPQFLKSILELLLPTMHCRKSGRDIGAMVILSLTIICWV